ncbi:MAG TPA: ACP S-malonyltransferase [Phototrophicaceae bacterium]|nr:ACP S-malonyltransferase [Phototrophicaceae bacterium]
MADWSTTVFVFPGQGSQQVGMAKDLYELYPAAREIFEQADAMLGFALTKLCFEGPESDLNDTINTQPALYVSGIATLRALCREIPEAMPAFVAGHSLGEFTALAAAGVFSFEDGLRLVRERGRLMKAAGTQSPGAMAATLGLETEQARKVCAQASEKTGGVLVVANDNCPGQLVISGDEATLDAAMGLAKEAGAKKVVKLAVSIAAHSPLMAPAAAEFRKALNATTFQPPTMPVYGNVGAAPLTTVEEIREELERQLTNSVRWTESVRAMIAAGATRFVELGPKDVLAGMMKRIDRSAPGSALNSAETLRAFVQENQN